VDDSTSPQSASHDWDAADYDDVPPYDTADTPPATDSAAEQYFDDAPPFDPDTAPPPDDYADEPTVPDKWPEQAVVPEITPVRGELREILARLGRRPTSDAEELIQVMASNTVVMGEIDPDERTLYGGVYDVLLHECSNNPTGVLDFTLVLTSPVLSVYPDTVHTELTHIAAIGTRDGTAFSRWQSLREQIARRRSRGEANKFIHLIDDKATVDELMEAHAHIEPPTVRQSVAHHRKVRTAREIDADAKALLTSQSRMRFSSGLRTLDLALTGKGEPIGFIGPGEQNVIAGITGTGKSSFSYSVLAGMTQDLLNWGLPHAYVVLFHTEEASADKVEASGLQEGGRFHHLAENVVVSDIGSSRRRIAETLYDMVIEAKKRSDLTGLPIRDFLPYIVMLDYIQAVTGERQEDPTTASAITAELILRGIQPWRPDEMAKFSGLSFQDYAGMTWPEGMENHEVAVITFAQLTKQDDDKMAFRSNAPRTHPLSDFTLEDPRPTPVWRDNQGEGGWLWEVREGDSRILKQNAIRGSGVILQNATNILFLHRSRPYNNPARIDPITGERHLEDTRARLIPDKTRNGMSFSAIPMAFDVDQRGPKARYYDPHAEAALLEGRFTPDSTWSEPGDPILPPRPKARPLFGVRY
jgi:hypothetical protein